MGFDYYKAPSEEIFQDIKKCSIALWKEIDPHYSGDKIHHIENIQNIRDNCGTIVAMFDSGNQLKLYAKTTGVTSDWLYELFKFANIF